MQDIDFDEIDRAVSSVTTPNVENPTPAPEPVVEAPAVVETPVEPAPEVPMSAPQPPRPSSGRFMDVVHPSSDMRPERTAAAAAPTFHREEVAERGEMTGRPEPTSATSSAFHWPDPIDAPAPAAEVPAPVVEAPASVEPPVPEPSNETSLESPFLSDAKVEKRPLGAFSESEAPAPTMAEPVKPAESADMPMELHNDLLTLEGHGEMPKAPETMMPEPATTPEVAPTPAEEMPAGPTSITQQYQEQPSTTPTTSGSIFDTEVYNQALVHTPKKNSGIKIVIWIIALILVGGGLGAGIYFVVLPMLG